MTTRLAPATRSMAPPMPLTILPGIIQLARLPSSSTSSAPSTVRSMWPPRTIANESALLKYDEPGSSVTVSLPALIRSAIDFALGRKRPDAEHAVLGVQRDLDARRHAVGDQRRHADAEVDVIAVAQVRAMRRTMRSRLSIARGPFLDALLVRRALQDALHEDARRMMLSASIAPVRRAARLPQSCAARPWPSPD